MTDSSRSLFVLDANVFIEARKRYYAFDIAPIYWRSLIQEFNKGNLLSIDRVNARGNLPQGSPSNVEITQESMRAYFGSLAEKSSPIGATKEAIDELERGDGITYNNVDDLLSDLNA